MFQFQEFICSYCSLGTVEKVETKKQPRIVLQEKVLLKLLPNSLENTCAGVSFLLKKKLWQRCFPVHFAKFFRATYLQSIRRQLFFKRVQAFFFQTNVSFVIKSEVQKPSARKPQDSLRKRKVQVAISKASNEANDFTLTSMPLAAYLTREKLVSV